MSSLTAQLRIHGKIPIVRTILRSEGMQVRDGMIERLKAMPPFAGFTFSRSHAFKVMPNLMPYCSVYFIGEQLTPDGDADIGEVSFHSVVRIGFSVMLINNDPDLMEDRLDDYYQLIFRGLLRDPTLQLNPKARIQGFAQGSRQHVYGSAGIQEHETPYAELRAELHCDLGAIEYEPLVEDMLESIHVETVYPPGDTNNQHIFSVYDLDTGSGQAIVPATGLVSSVGSAAGTGAAHAVGSATGLLSAVGSAAGSGTANAAGSTIVGPASSVGSAAGTGTANAVRSPAWAVVQSKKDTTGSGISKVLAFNAPIASGNIVVGGLLISNAGVFCTGIADDKGNIYDITGQDGQSEFTHLHAVGFKSRGGITNSPQTLTFSFSASSGLVWSVMDEFTAGFSLPATCASTGSQNSVRHTGGQLPFKNIRSDDLLYSAVFSTAVATVGAGWAATQGSGSQQMAIWKAAAAPGLNTPTYATSGDVWSASMAVHQSASPPIWRLRQQQIQMTQTSIAAGGTATISLPSAMASGSVGLGVIALGTQAGGDNNLANLTSLVDDKGNTWSVMPGHNGGRGFIWSGATPLTNGPQTLTATVNHTEVILYFLLNEFVPPAGATVITAEPTNVTTMGATSPFTVGPVTPSRDNALVYAFVDNGGNGNRPSDGFWSLNDQYNSWTDAWQQQVAAAAISAQFTGGGSGMYRQGIAALTYA